MARLRREAEELRVLRESEEGLRKLASELEQRVAEQTKEIRQANEALEGHIKALENVNNQLEMEVTERSKAQDALDAANTDLERSNRELELFASVASHDLQEPLRTITSYIELLAHKYGDKLDQQADQYMGFIMDGAHHLQTLINDLLAYSRVGTRAKPFAPVKMDSVLDQVLGGMKKTIAESNTQVERDELPEVLGDDVQLAQLFQNLIANAVKFRKNEAASRIRVTIKEDGDEWIFGVHDNGIGIDPQYSERIFQIFRRLHTREEYEGSGMGLAICRKIVEHHGGRIWVESTRGEGSSFYFTLPAQRGNHEGSQC